MTRGRPKTFNDDAVLEKAMLVFWRKGFDAATLEDIDQATGIPRQSLYRSFKNKRTLFLLSLDYYQDRVASRILSILEQDRPAIENIKAVFDSWQSAIASKNGLGCLMGNTAAQFLPNDEDVRARVLHHQERFVSSFEQALIQGQNEGCINKSIKAKSMARTIIITTTGLLTMSRVTPPPEAARDVLDTLILLIEPDKKQTI